MTKLAIIRGIESAIENKLKELGIVSVESLLEACATKKARTELAKKTGIPEDKILTWSNHADLIRIRGVGGKYSELLEAVGVDTVPELSKRNPENLYLKMIEVNEKEKLVEALPAKKQIIKWVEQAKKLPRVLQY